MAKKSIFFFKAPTTKSSLVGNVRDIFLPNMFRVRLRDICVITSHTKKSWIKVITIDGSEYYLNSTLNDFSKLKTYFARLSKSHVINLKHLDSKYEYLYCWVLGNRFSISKNYRKEFKNKLSNFCIMRINPSNNNE